MFLLFIQNRWLVILRTIPVFPQLDEVSLEDLRVEPSLVEQGSFMLARYTIGYRSSYQTTDSLTVVITFARLIDNGEHPIIST